MLLDWQTILAIVVPICGLMSWIYSRLDKRFDKIDQRFDRLEEKVEDIDRRLCRLEGAFSAKECCVIKEDRHYRRAEG